MPAVLDWLIDSKWPPRIMLGATLALWIASLFNFGLAGFAVALGILTWGRYEEKAYERRRTAPERAKRYRRELELAWLAHCDARGHLERILIADLKQIRARHEAREYIDALIRSRQ